jgi:hypothetical protein
MDISFSQLVSTVIRKHGIKSIEIKFAGSGDEGCLEEPEVLYETDIDESSKVAYSEKINTDISKIVNSASEECGLLDNLNEFLDTEYIKGEFVYNYKEHIFRLLKEWVLWYLDNEYTGWQDNEGIHGKFVWNADKDTCQFIRNVPTTTFEEYEEQI